MDSFSGVAKEKYQNWIQMLQSTVWISENGRFYTINNVPENHHSTLSTYMY